MSRETVRGLYRRMNRRGDSKNTWGFVSSFKVNRRRGKPQFSAENDALAERHSRLGFRRKAKVKITMPRVSMPELKD